MATALDSEIAARKSADTTLNVNLGARIINEAKSRTTADSSLDVKIKALEALVIMLDTRIKVLEASLLPVISNIAISNLTDTDVTISWHVSVLAQGWVEYGLTTAYGSLTAKELSFDYQEHNQNIAGLSNNTTYHYRIHAVDQLANDIVSADGTFITSSTLTLPAVPAVTIISGDQQATVGWT